MAEIHYLFPRGAGPAPGAARPPEPGPVAGRADAAGVRVVLSPVAFAAILARETHAVGPPPPRAAALLRRIPERPPQRRNRLVLGARPPDAHAAARADAIIATPPPFGDAVRAPRVPGAWHVVSVRAGHPALAPAADAHGVGEAADALLARQSGERASFSFADPDALASAIVAVLVQHRAPVEAWLARGAVPPLSLAHRSRASLGSVAHPGASAVSDLHGLMATLALRDDPQPYIRLVFAL